MMKDKYTIHTLELGELLHVDISSRKKYSKHQLNVSASQKYAFKVDRQASKWWDLIIPTRGEGWDSIISPKNGRRVPSKPLLHLCGCMDYDDTSAFGIGLELKHWSPRQDGILSFFANDYSAMYFNNWGRIRLGITRMN